MADSEPISTRALVDNYMESREAVARTRQRLRELCNKFHEDEQRLGLRIAPQNMEDGEIVGVWERYRKRDVEYCFMVLYCKNGPAHYAIEIRGER